MGRGLSVFMLPFYFLSSAPPVLQPASSASFGAVLIHCSKKTLGRGCRGVFETRRT